MTGKPHNPRALAAAGDVVLIYQIFLGRPPEDAQCIEANQDRALEELARSFIGCAEFAARLAAIEDGRVGATAENPEPDTATAARDLVARITGTAVPESENTTFRGLLGLALGSASLWPHFAAIFGIRSAALLDAISADAPATADSDWMGFIDFASDWLIRGWVYRKGDKRPVRLGVMIDGKLIAHTEASRYRSDVAGQFDHPGNCGFELKPMIPDTLQHENAQLSLVDLGSGAPLPFRRQMLFSQPTVPPAHLDEHLNALVRSIGNLTDRLAGFGVPGPVPLTDYHFFRDRYRLPAAPAKDRDTATGSAAFSLILPLLPDLTDGFDRTLASLLAQDWPGWELIVVTGRGRHSVLPDSLRTILTQDKRIRLMQVVGLRNAVEARAVGIRAAGCSHVIPLVPGTVLEPQALRWIAHALRQTGARAVYTDHCHASPLGAAETLYGKPVLKPSFDPDLLLQEDYIGPIYCLDAALARGSCEKEDAYAADLLFRATHRLQGRGIAHLPLPLFQLPLPSDAAALANIHQRAAMAHLARTGGQARFMEGKPPGLGQHHDTLQWPSPTTGRRLAIIIATRDRRELLQPCIDSIRRNLADPAACEIIVVDNRSSDPLALAYLAELDRSPDVRVLPFDEEFNWSRANNIAAASSSADILLFMNNDIEVITPGFDEVIRQQLARPDAGVLGCLLLYPDGLIQHAGTVTGISGIAAHIGVGQSPAALDLGGWHHVTRRITAVTGAFMAIPAALFAQMGAFDETELKITLSDVDFCLKAANAGHAVRYTPVITCLHHESASRGDDDRDSEKRRRAAHEQQAFCRKWQQHLRFDMFQSPGFSLSRPPFSHVVMPTTEGTIAYLARQISAQTQDVQLP